MISTKTKHLLQLHYYIAKFSFCFLKSLKLEMTRVPTLVKSRHKM